MERLEVSPDAIYRPVLRDFEVRPEDAQQRFEKWLHRNKIAVSNVRQKSSFLPFLCFRGDLEVRLDGAIGYTVHYMVRKRQMERTDWYVRQKILLNKLHLPDTSPLTQVLGSFAQPRNIVNMAMLQTDTSRGVRDFASIDQAGPHEVQEVMARPNFGLFKILTKLERQAEEHAMDYLLENPTGHFVEVREGFFAREGGAGIHPEMHERRPDKARIRHLFTHFHNPTLTRLVYLPAYLFDYQVAGQPFLAVVNGVDGRLAGVRGLGMNWQRQNAENLRAIDESQNIRVPTLPRCWRNHDLRAGYDPRDGRETSYNPRSGNAWWRETHFNNRDFHQRHHGQAEGEEQEWKQAKPPPSSIGTIKSKYVWSKFDDFEILGLARIPPPSALDISKAFRQEAKAHHPDMNMHRSDKERTECNARFRRIRQAYVTLRRLR